MNANKSVGLVFFPAFDWAISPTHPEREERLLYTQDQIFEEGIQDIEGIEMFNPLVATHKDIQRVHFAIPDVPTRVTESHLVASGGAIRAALAVMNKEVTSAFALVRPPGHHAHRVVYGDRGFCVTNNEAIMVERIRAEFGSVKVAIIDTDCHHGDGTEDIYWNDPNTLVISFHQDGRTLYPGTGFMDAFGGPSAYGYNVNIPLPPNTGDEGFLHVLNHVVMPILDDFAPDLIINSAGQDNHYSDPLTNMNFSAQGYAKLNSILKPDIAVLEGGYSIEGALPYINVGIILAMAGMDYSGVKEPDYNPNTLTQSKEITEYVKKLSDAVLSNWKKKDILWNKEYGALDSYERPMQIYYDTDGILEQQTQHFSKCSRCSGYNWIVSTSDSGYKVLAITIPSDGCPSCIDKAYKLYANPPSSYTHIYMQDRANDEYLSKR